MRLQLSFALTLSNQSFLVKKKKLINPLSFYGEFVKHKWNDAWHIRLKS